MKHIIRIQEVGCTGCGDCVKDCPQNVIYLEDKLAKLKHQDCIMCGHCQAVCPENVISISGFTEEPVALDTYASLAPTELLHAMRSRRSTRQYNTDPIRRDLLEQLLSAGNAAPTLKNAQDVRYIVLENSLHEVEGLAYKILPKLFQEMNVSKERQDSLLISEHFFSFGTPMAIAIFAETTIDAHLAAANIALMAEALKLGTLYSGFLAKAINLSPEIQKRIGAEGKCAIVLLVGHPEVHYLRTTQKHAPMVSYQ